MVIPRMHHSQGPNGSLLMVYSAPWVGVGGGGGMVAPKYKLFSRPIPWLGLPDSLARHPFRQELIYDVRPEPRTPIELIGPVPRGDKLCRQEV